MTDVGGIAGAQLKSCFERVERLREEIRALQADVSEVFKEAKACGFDTKVMKIVLKDRSMDRDDLAERDELVDLYKHAVGMADDPSPSRASARAPAPAREGAPAHARDEAKPVEAKPADTKPAEPETSATDDIPPALGAAAGVTDTGIAAGIPVPAAETRAVPSDAFDAVDADPGVQFDQRGPEDFPEMPDCLRRGKEAVPKFMVPEFSPPSPATTQSATS